MFSNDKNIETIGQLVDTFKHYIGLQQEYVKLDVIEKVVKLLTVLVVGTVIGLLLCIVLVFLSIMLAYAIAPVLGNVAAFAIIAGIYALLLLLFVIFRHRWVEKPLVKLLADILLS